MSLELRPARPTDAGTIGDILHRFAAETPWMPELYSGAEAISFCGVMIDRGWVTVAEEGARVLGFLARDGPEICALYLAPEARGQGIGKRLLEAAKGGSGHLGQWGLGLGADRVVRGRQKCLAAARHPKGGTWSRTFQRRARASEGQGE